MYAKQKKKPEKTFEIRLRAVPKEINDTLTSIAVSMREATATGAIIKMIVRFRDMQKQVTDLQKRNTELHAAIAKYYHSEDQTRRFINELSGGAKSAGQRLLSYHKQLEQHAKKHGTKKRPGRTG